MQPTTVPELIESLLIGYLRDVGLNPIVDKSAQMRLKGTNIKRRLRFADFLTPAEINELMRFELKRMARMICSYEDYEDTSARPKEIRFNVIVHPGSTQTAWIFHVYCVFAAVDYRSLP
jgi:hypothetical protein